MKNNIFGTGQKFKVIVSGSNNYGVGSRGFISYFDCLDSSFMNLAKMNVVMTRRGKGGKDRVEPASIYIPIFTIDHKGFAKAMPSGGTREPYLQIKKNLESTTNIMELSPIDFLGWATAHVLNLRHLCEICKHSTWPLEKSHWFNRIRSMISHFDDNPDMFLNDYTSEEFRHEIIDSIRPKLSSMIRISLIEQLKRTKALTNAASFLVFVNSGEFLESSKDKKENEYRFTEDEASLAENLKAYKKMEKEMTKFSGIKSKKS